MDKETGRARSCQDAAEAAARDLPNPLSPHTLIALRNSHHDSVDEPVTAGPHQAYLTDTDLLQATESDDWISCVAITVLVLLSSHYQ